jgi:pimeloyl-ACP methyl ester carboxylesterase
LEINSFADFVRMTRSVLAASGFQRREVDGTVYFESVLSGAPGSQPGEGGRAESPSLQRETLVLIHGANDQAGTWFTVAPALARSYRVIIPDLPGHGDSAPRSGPLPISLMLDRLEAILANERDLTMVGNSLGGWLALLYTLRHPSQVSRLFLESSGGLTRPLSSPLVARDRDEALAIMRAVHGPNVQPKEWAIEALLQRASDSPMLRLTEVPEHVVEYRLGELEVPATLIWGAHDGVLPLSYGEALQQAIPGARMNVIEGAAHIPHLQQPERFLACLTAIS